MKRCVDIIDCGWGNLEALRWFFMRITKTVNILSLNDLNAVRNDVIILPGVGSANLFGEVSAEKREMLRCKIQQAERVVSICLGAQFLFSSHQESVNGAGGLSLLSGSIKKLHRHNIGYVPKPRGDRYYFNHGYFMPVEGPYATSWTLNVGEQEFLAEAEFENILLCQYHPEKSGGHGLNRMKRFLNA